MSANDRQINKFNQMNDLLPDQLNENTELISTALQYLSKTGYQQVETPIIEDSDLFARKGGGELMGLVCTFSDARGQRVSLRPEFTSSIIRLYIEQNNKQDTETKWSYAGPVFRYRSYGQMVLDQFTQVGGEIIGDKGANTDSELICTAYNGLKKLGVKNPKIKIGDAKSLSRFFNTFEISDAAKQFIKSNLGNIRSGSTDQKQLVELALDSGLTNEEGRVAGTDAGSKTLLELEELAKDQINKPLGRRTPTEIITRLESKGSVATDKNEFSRAVDFASKMVSINGDSNNSLDSADQLINIAGLDSKFFDPLKSLLLDLENKGLPSENIILDFGMVRGISYYTGMIFELTSENDSISLGGGGRYDKLAANLGGANSNALGFAYNIDAISEAIK